MAAELVHAPRGPVGRVLAALRKAQSEVERLELEVARWEADAEAKRAELAALEAGVGDVMLAGEGAPSARELAVTALELRFTIDGAKAAARSTETKLREARWALADAQAAELREKAATVRAEAVKRQARVDELKAALEEFEGGDWRPRQPDAQDVVQAGAAGIMLVPLRTPPLFEQARQLDAQAQAIEDRVAGERRQAAVLVPHAEVHWDGQQHYKGTVSVLVAAGVNDGRDSMEFEVLLDGAVVQRFTLPDERGRRGWREHVDVFAEGTLSVRAAGRVLASRRVELPPGTVNLSHPVSIR